MRYDSTPKHILPQDLPDRLIRLFWNHVEKTDGCWKWNGAVRPKGYGQLHLGNGLYIYAHRVSWLLHIGEIPETMLVLHRCDRPPCCRPDHLFLGTHLDNQRDKWAKGRAKLWDHIGNHNAQILNEDQVREIQKRYDLGNCSQKSLAIEFSVHQVTISQIVRRIPAYAR